MSTEKKKKIKEVLQRMVIWDILIKILPAASLPSPNCFLPKSLVALMLFQQWKIIITAIKLLNFYRDKGKQHN